MTKGLSFKECSETFKYLILLLRNYRSRYYRLLLIRFIYDCIPYSIREQYRKLKRFFGKRYAMVRFTKMNWHDYHDIDERIIHANFELLREFVEEEKGLDIIDFDFDKQHRKVKQEMLELLEWWKGYPYSWKTSETYDTKWKDYKISISDMLKRDKNNHIRFNLTSTDKEYVTDMREWETNYEKITDKNLIRIIKIRKYFWS